MVDVVDGREELETHQKILPLVLANKSTPLALLMKSLHAELQTSARNRHNTLTYPARFDVFYDLNQQH